MSTMQEQILRLQTQQTDMHLRLQMLEDKQTFAKPWFLSKGVMGPLISGAATVSLVIGYIMNWPGEAMALIASIAGGGSITGIVGRLTATRAIK